MLLVIHQEEHMWPPSILFQFWLTDEKKAEFHRCAYNSIQKQGRVVAEGIKFSDRVC